MTQSFETHTFRMSQGAFLRHIFLRYGRVPIIIPAFISLGCVVAGIIFDLRWIIVAMMVILIALPAIAAWLYFDYGLRLSTAFNVLPHRVEVTPDNVIIHIDTIIKRDGEETEEEVKTKDVVFPRTEIGKVEREISSALIHLDANPPGFIWVPYRIGEGDEDDGLQLIHTLEREA